MECKDLTKNGSFRLSTGSKFTPRGLGWQFCSSAGNLRLDFPTLVPGQQFGHKMLVGLETAKEPNTNNHVLQFHVPFMNNMDEITYWIYTKRAPCLMHYDNEFKKQKEESHNSKHKPKSVPSAAEVPSPKKKKKRKLSLLDDDSLSEKQPNLYFDTSQKKKKPVISNCESDTLDSDINFNIKNTSVQGKPKRKQQRNGKTVLHKKNMVLTSTPKVSNLRRSLRQAQQNSNNISQLNSSFELFESGNVNGNGLKCSATEQKPTIKSRKTSKVHAGGDQTVDSNKIVNLTNSKHEVLNGQFEDLSDVSGFTANYIRSTRLQSSKSPRKLRSKNNRSLVRESRTSQPNDDTIVVCINKSMNTGLPNNTALNCSTDSSQNIINLVSSKNTDKSAKVSKSTSLLKFIEATKSPKKSRQNITRSKSNLNISFQSNTSSAPRYPTRYRNSVIANLPTGTNDSSQTAEKTQRLTKNSSTCNYSDRKENPDATTESKTRSGRSLGLALRQAENSVLVLSNSTEHVSSTTSINVAAVVEKEKVRKKKRVTRYLRTKRLKNKSGDLPQDSLRDKSDFTACFSDSDDDSEPLKQRKFFCA